MEWVVSTIEINGCTALNDIERRVIGDGVEAAISNRMCRMVFGNHSPLSAKNAITLITKMLLDSGYGKYSGVCSCLDGP